MGKTYVITEACIGVKDATCVDVCPAACIHTTPMAPYYIDPDVCIACEQCELVCPVNAIFLDDDLPSHLEHYLEINARFFEDNKPAAEPLTTDQAKAIVSAVVRYAEDAGYAIAVAVVDGAGEHIESSAMAGAATDLAALALNKPIQRPSCRWPPINLGAVRRRLRFKSRRASNTRDLSK